MKYIIIILLIYLAYRFLFAPPALPFNQRNQIKADDKNKGDYIDYEEVDDK